MAKAHILLVEDDELNVVVFKKLLTKRGGFEVTHTEDVSEILELCQSGKIDLVIMDVSLGRSMYQGKFIDGVEITKLLKSDPRTSSIPVLLTTAHAMTEDRNAFLEESGADGYISKPVVDHAAFIETINRHLQQASQ